MRHGQRTHPGGPWYAKVRWPVDFILTEGVWNRRASEEERSCRERTQVLRISARYCGPVPITEEKQMEESLYWFVAGLEASEVHAKVGNVVIFTLFLAFPLEQWIQRCCGLGWWWTANLFGAVEKASLYLTASAKSYQRVFRLCSTCDLSFTAHQKYRAINMHSSSKRQSLEMTLPRKVVSSVTD